MPFISGTQLWQWRQQAQQEAIATDIDSTEIDWLLREITQLDSLALRLESFRTYPQVELTIPFTELVQLWQQRIHDAVPLQYLVGMAPWRHFNLKVSPNVLIPRPETEQIIDICLAASQEHPALAQGNWVDLGTGSGAIALGLAEVFPQATIYATDISVSALAIAQENAQHLGLGSRIKFYQGSWWEPLADLNLAINGVVSNPPYIPTDMVSQLQPEVVNHEPHLALDGGEDGLEYIRHLVNISPNYLCPGSLWLVEMMAGQAQGVTNLLQQQGSYQDIKIISDLAGIERFALAYCLN